MTPNSSHWNTVYRLREKSKLTWFEEHPDISLSCLEPHLAPNEPVIDIGAGRSHLAAKLLERDLGPVTLLDVSQTALDAQRAELGDRVRYICADIIDWRPSQAYRAWHDRAVFHFLTQPEQQRRYFENMCHAVALGGIAVIATFDETGPKVCSELPVQRYSPTALYETMTMFIPNRFEKLIHHRHVHRTPLGNSQSFQFSIFQRVA